MKKSTNNIIIEFLGLIIGCMFMGVGLNMFFKPYTIAPGGLSGLSLVISKFTGLSVSTIMLPMDPPIIAIKKRFFSEILYILFLAKYLSKYIDSNPTIFINIK